MLKVHTAFENTNLAGSFFFGKIGLKKLETPGQKGPGEKILIQSRINHKSHRHDFWHVLM